LLTRGAAGPGLEETDLLAVAADTVEIGRAGEPRLAALVTRAGLLDGLVAGLLAEGCVVRSNVVAGAVVGAFIPLHRIARGLTPTEVAILVTIPDPDTKFLRLAPGPLLHITLHRLLRKAAAEGPEAQADVIRSVAHQALGLRTQLDADPTVLAAVDAELIRPAAILAVDRAAYGAAIPPREPRIPFLWLSRRAKTRPARALGSRRAGGAGWLCAPGIGYSTIVLRIYRAIDGVRTGTSDQDPCEQE
jgi:hypothetical protein